MSFVDVFDQLANVAQVARKCPTPVLRRAYVTAMRDWCMQTRWLRIPVTGATQSGTALYGLGTDPFLEIIAIQAVSGSQTTNGGVQKWPIGPTDPGGWDSNAPVNRPWTYSYVPEGQIALYPTPDAVYNLLITAVVQPKEGVVQIPAEPLKKYSTCFEGGALEYLLTMKDTPWHNPAEAARQGRIYAAGIANGKAEVQRNYNTGAQRVRPRPFI